MYDDLAILIVYFNKTDQTIECIRSFEKSLARIYVFNNGSDEQQFKRLKKTFSVNSRITFFNSEKNIGPAAARNRLIESTDEQWLFFVDNDITIHPANWLTILESNPIKNDVDVICPALFNTHDNEFARHPGFILAGNKIKLDYEGKLKNYFPSGASIIKRRVFEKFGKFDNEIYAFEDYEFAIRLLTRGQAINIIECTKIRLDHSHIFQKRKNDKDAVRERYNMERLGKSFHRIEQLHNIHFEHNWEWWTKKQREEMTEPRFWRKIKHRFKKLVRR